MRKLAYLLLLLAIPACATDYYVDPAGSNGAAGISPATAWASAPNMVSCNSVCASTTLVPGDRVLLLRGGTWHDQIVMTTATLGTATQPIVYSDYGSGAGTTCTTGSNCPILDGANVISGWASLGGNKYSITYNPGFTFRGVYRNNVLGVNETTTGALTANYEWNYTGTTLTIFSTTNPSSDSSVWEAGARWHGIRNDTSAWMIWANLHIIHTDDNSNDGGGFAMNPQVAGRAANQLLINLLIEYSVDNGVLLFDTTASLSGFSMYGVNVAHTSFHGGGRPGIQIGQGAENGGLGVANVTVIGGSATYTGDPGNGGAIQGNFGIEFATASNVKVDGFNALLNGDSGFAVSSGSNGVAVNGGVFDFNGTVTGGAGDKDGLEVGGFGNGSSNVTYTGIHAGWNQGPQIEIASTLTDHIMTNVTITKSVLIGGPVDSFQIGGGHVGIVFSYNRVLNSGALGIRVNAGSSGNPDLKVYGNIITGSVGDGIDVNANGTEMKNNAIFNNGGQELATTGGVTLTSDFNDFYHAAGGNFMTFHGTPTNFAGWKSSSSQDASSISSLPLFQNSAANDFRPIAGSPLIDVGTNLGFTFQTALNEAAPVGYSGANQNSFGAGWEIGPYVYDSTVTPSSGVAF